MSTYTMTEATRRTAELVAEARYRNEPVMITDHGKPAAVVISPAQYARFQQLEEAADRAEIERIRARSTGEWVDHETGIQMMADILAEADAKAEAADKLR